ncbi:hypothetical protein LJK88_29105 [Paenibacillus sp. P26]|nr:hypothetical protein LJK88_29105 [Paenibacillus sp. P26]
MESGQFTLEASLTAPAILLATVLLLFLALFAYFHANVYQTSALTAERAAFVWDNSNKDPVTGAVASGQHDGLYWRLTNDHVSGLFRFLPQADVRVALPAAEAPSSGAVRRRSWSGRFKA